MRNPSRDWMSWVDGPHQLPVVFRTPAQGAGRSHELHKELRPVSGMEHDEPHPLQHVAMDALDNLVADLGVGRVSPPGQHVGLRQLVFGEPVFRVVESRGGDGHPTPKVLLNPFPDGVVHALRVDICDVLFDLFVPVLAPDQDVDRASGSFCVHCLVPYGVRIRRSVKFVGWDVEARYLRAPPRAPAVMYRWAKTSRMIAGIEATTAVAMTGPQLWTCPAR